MSNKSKNVILPIICGLTAANAYYIQPLIPEAAQRIGVEYSLVSMIYIMTLIGNSIALMFITPIGDFFYRDKVISYLYMLLFAALLMFYLSTNIYLLIAISFFIGLGASAIPMIIAHLSTNKTSGIDSIGKIMAGVLFGILLSRFVSSFFASFWGWKSIYLFAAGGMLCAFILIQHCLPEDKSKKERQIGYFQIVFSAFSLLRFHESVRLYSLNGFLIMAVFSSFWTNISIYLTHQFGFEQFAIGVFSLASILGAVTALFSRQMLKLFKASSAGLFILLLACFLLMTFYSDYLIILVILTLILDGLIQLLHVGNQMNMYRDCNGNESRAASCYMTSFVLGGAVGAKLSTHIYLHYGWASLSIFCTFLCITGLILNGKLRQKNLAA